MYFTNIGLRSSISRTAASRAATTSAADPECSTVASAATTCSTTSSSTARRNPSLVPKWCWINPMVTPTRAATRRIETRSSP